MTFVDDTDLSTLENTEPVYTFLAERGFWGTKTVWPLRARRTSAFRLADERDEPDPDSGATLEDPDYAAFIQRLQQAGFEIAMHGVAAGNSRRDEIKAGLAHFRAIVGKTPAMNAFHRTNLENLYCGVHKLDAPLLRLVERLSDHSDYEGHREGTVSFWGDLARETFRYVRLPFHTIDEINTLRVNPSMPFCDPRRPYVRRWFAGSDGADVIRFNRLLSETNVARLVRESGVCVVYTHFAKGFARRCAGVYTLDDDFRRTVERLTSHSDGWFAPASDVLDRLAALKSLWLRHTGRDVIVHNTGTCSVHDVVLRVSAGTEISLNGRTMNASSDTVVLPHLSPMETLALTTNRAGRQTIETRGPEAARREHRHVEYRNYLGLVRGWYEDRRYYARRGRAPLSTTKRFAGLP
ncbi:MAG: hypothetical protein ABI885_01895 [Gammaproteobacteria bacterium]